jgi:hypothetical protein
LKQVAGTENQHSDATPNGTYNIGNPPRRAFIKG